MGNSARPREGPPSASEIAHIEALRIALRLPAWPAEDSRRRVLHWLRLLELEWRGQRNAKQKAARAHHSRRPSNFDSPD